ncbi:MAG: hypothetical protein PHF35_02900 [Candidatus Moranbacteria bacterium]|nr:hypothetical protein [Candidatus Moranbacteria bacterium]
MRSFVFMMLGFVFLAFSLIFFLLERWLRKQKVDPLTVLIAPLAVAMAEEKDELFMHLIRIVAKALRFLGIVLLIISLFL